MKTLKIFEDLYQDSFVLLAIHSSLEDYALVYRLNSQLGTRLKRGSGNLEIIENLSFPYYEWKDDMNDREWTLITNHCLRKEEKEMADLFGPEQSYTVHHLIPECRDADYLLKIEEGDERIEDEVVHALQKIPEVIMSYVLEHKNLKSRHNLIF